MAEINIKKDETLLLPTASFMFLNLSYPSCAVATILFNLPTSFPAEVPNCSSPPDMFPFLSTEKPVKKDNINFLEEKKNYG